MQYVNLRSLFIYWNRWVRQNLLRLLLLIGIVSIFTSIAWSATTSSIVYTGVAAGDATETSVILWTRTTNVKDLQGIVQPLDVDQPRNLAKSVTVE